MEIIRHPIAGLVGIVPRVFADARGSFAETYSTRNFAEALGDVRFVQDNHSISAKRGTVRGLHFQLPDKAQGKLIRVTRGAIIDVALDLRPKSPTYLQHVAVELSAANGMQLYVPRGCAHGFCTLEDETEVLYKTDELYSPEHDRGILWSDPALGIAWPVTAADAVLSDKDAKAPLLANIPAPFPDWGI